MPVCSIRQCGVRKSSNRPDLTLHRFPRNAALKKKWMDIIGVNNINPHHKEPHVCSLHFEESCFNRTLDVIRLRDESVPSSSLLDPVAHKSSTGCQQAPTNFLKENHSLASTCDIVPTDEQKPSVLRQKGNIQEPHDSAMTQSQFSTINLVQASAERERAWRQKEELKKLRQTCKDLRCKMKCLNEKIRKRDKKIAALNDIVKDLLDSMSEQK